MFKNQESEYENQKPEPIPGIKTQTILTGYGIRRLDF
jgi:hypothetical protein